MRPRKSKRSRKKVPSFFAAAVASSSRPSAVVTPRIELLAQAMIAAVDLRLGAATSPAASMKLFTGIGPGYTGSTFTPNAACWLQDLRAKLTGFHMGAGAYTQSYGLIPLGGNYALNVAHNGPEPLPLALKYINTDGSVFTTTATHWINDRVGASSSDTQQSPVTDLMIYVLADVLPSWVSRAPIVSLTSAERLALGAFDPPSVAISQGNWADGPSTPYGLGNTPDNRMAYVKSASLTYPLSSLRSPYFHGARTGDSGNPEYLCLANDLYLFRVIADSGGSGPIVGDYISYINALIARGAAVSGKAAITVSSVPLSALDLTIYTVPVVVTSGATITLTGNDISGNETGFRDEKSTVAASGPWTPLGTRSGALTGRGVAYSVSYAAQPFNTRMWLRTIAFNGSGDGPAYTAKEIVTRPNELPSAFAAAPDGAYAMNLSWVEPAVAPLSGGYQLFHFNGTEYYHLDNILSGGNTYRHAGLLAASAHSYRLIPYNQSPDGATSLMATYVSVTQTTATSPYIIAGDFDTGLDERGISGYWSTIGYVGTNYPNASIWGGTSVYVANGASIYRTFDPVDNLSVFFGMKASAAYFRLMDIGGARILLTGEGGMYLGSAANEYLAFAAVSGGAPYYPGEPVVYLWVDYIKTQGATPGSLSVLFSSSPVKPTPNSSNFVTVSDASFTAQASKLQLMGPTQFDHVRASSVITIGSTPP